MEEMRGHARQPLRQSGKSQVTSARKWILILVFVCCSTLGVATADGLLRTPDWTIMVFMNAKNNLECAGIANFRQMASIGSTERVNIVVELGRPASNRYTNDEEDWTGVLRFRVTQDMHPVPSSAINADDPNVRNADMGSGKTLADFVQWAKRSYPARRYMLVIWNHGQGWRLYQASKAIPYFHNVDYRPSNLDDSPKTCDAPSQQTLTGGVRSVSFDEDTGHFLYNRDIQNRLEGQHLNIIGFDACLMAMIEGAYAFRNVASLMIASEELVPGDGWNYSQWLRNLQTDPGMDEVRLAKDIVRSYADTYQDSGDTTLSVIDLARVEDANRALSKVSQLIKRRISKEGPFLASARLSFRPFGDWYQDSWQDCHGSKVMRFQGVDLIQFLTLYRRETTDSQIRNELDNAKRQLQRVVVQTYASSESAGADHWASGLAVYFPSTELDFQCDPDRDGYNVEAVRAGLVQFAPEFVEGEGWPDLLHEYLLSRLSPTVVVNSRKP